MTRNKVFQRLSRLLDEARTISVRPGERFVVFSDLHVGDRSSRDEFRHNSLLFQRVLKRHYLPANFQLILNGDIEELHKFSYQKIHQTWSGLYRLFDQFAKQNGLHKVLGNHDADLCAWNGYRIDKNVHNALRLNFESGNLFILHGHQADRFTGRFNPLFRFFIRSVAAPLGVNNYSVAYDKKKRYRTERCIYEFARANRLAALIGHTHRPLFESLSRLDFLRYRIEQLCREYPNAPTDEQDALAEKIHLYQDEVAFTLAKNRKNGTRSSIYNEDPLVPCLFNSGCVIGKRGITALEIADGKISLVHWFDKRRSDKYLNWNGHHPERMEKSNFFRCVLKEDNLDYIFTRIKLLA